MSGFIKILGIVAFIAALFWVRGAIIRSGIEADSATFLKETIGTVTLNWNRGELDRNADPALAQRVKAVVSPHPLDFEHFARLGARTSELNCKSGDYQTYKDETRNYVSVNYSCSAMFEHGQATIQLSIMRDRDDMPWRIAYFDVVSPVLAASTPTQR